MRPILAHAGVPVLGWSVNSRSRRLLVGLPGDRNPGVVLGVDVGGTKVAVAAVDGVTVHEATEHPTLTASTEALLDGIEAAVRDVIEQVGQPEAIGVGVPSQIEYSTGTVETSVNIPLTGVPLREELGRRFGVPVFVDNDANCAALAEAHLLGDGPSRDAHARHRRRRRGRDRRDDLPRRARPRAPSSATSRSTRTGRRARAAAPTAAASRPTAPARRSSATPPSWPPTSPTAGSRARSAPTGKVSGRELVAGRRGRRPRRAADLRQLRAHARRRDRRLRQRVRARPAGDRRRAVAREPPVPRPRRAGGGRARPARALAAHQRSRSPRAARTRA